MVENRIVANWKLRNLFKRHVFVLVRLLNFGKKKKKISKGFEYEISSAPRKTHNQIKNEANEAGERFKLEGPISGDVRAQKKKNFIFRQGQTASLASFSRTGNARRKSHMPLH